MEAAALSGHLRLVLEQQGLHAGGAAGGEREVQDLGRLTNPFGRRGVGNLFTVKEGLGVKLSGHQAGLRLTPALA